jgi:dynein heavy chain
MEMAPGFKMTEFRKQFQDLLVLFDESRDNVRFLTTLERHFKNISIGTLSTIRETIPSMLDSLRMVWVISRHFSKGNGHKMSDLMKLVADEIASKVERTIRINQMFRRPPAQISKTIDEIEEARLVLDLWETSCLKTRTTLESKSTGTEPWSFDQAKLFGRTKYMKGICVQLKDVAKTLDEFGQILGSELQSVTDDHQKIKAVRAEVNSLTVPLENLAGFF